MVAVLLGHGECLTLVASLRSCQACGMFAQDIRYAFRGLIRDGGVTAVVITCLALGIGINATLFSVVDGVLIQSLPFADPDRLLILHSTFEKGGIRRGGVSFRDLEIWKMENFLPAAKTTTR
jgi:hypothetical protein